MAKKICPSCRGNGYTKQQVRNSKVRIIQCKICKSQGEIKYNG